MTDTAVPTIYDHLIANARTRRDSPAMYHGQRVLGHAEVLARSRAMAAALAERGVGPGDLVGVLAKKTPEAIMAFYGAAILGAVFYPLDFYQPPAVLRPLQDRLDPAALVLDPEFRPLFETLYPHGAPFPVLSMDEADTDDGPLPPDPTRSPNEPAYLNFTSGTTGQPKAAVTTLANLQANTRAANAALGVTADDIHLCMMPFFVHPHEIFMRPLVLGGAMVLTDTIAPWHVAGLIRRHEVTCFMAVASIYETLVRLGPSASLDFFSLRVPESGGMFAASALQSRFEALFGRRMLPVWGSTETAGIALATRPGDPPRPGSMGRACPGYAVRLLDPSGREVAGEGEGEMCIQGPGVCPGYLGRDPAPGDALGRGRFLTGDMVRRDADGFHYFLGRRHHMIKVGGMKVYPAEIEEAIRRHPDVLEAHVLAVADPLRGEAARAVVVPRPGSGLDRAELRRHLETLLHRHKLPRQIEFRDHLPRTPGGKIAWRELL